MKVCEDKVPEATPLKTSEVITLQILYKIVSYYWTVTTTAA